MYKSKLAKIVSFIWARKLVRQSFLDYVAHIWDGEVESPSIESILLVPKFREVFPTDFHSMTLDRDKHLCIDLESITCPISIPTIA